MIRKPRQSGVALALVLLIMAISMTMGLSYLASSSISLAASQGVEDAARARYLSESGIQHAMCLLRENPDMLIASVGAQLGPYYVDDETSAYKIEVTPSGIPGYFIVSSWASSGRSRQSVAATVFHSDGTRDPIEYAALVGAFPGFISEKVAVTGKVHGNSNVIIEGTVDGDVSAVGSVANMGSINGSIESNTSVVAIPDFDPADYEHYLYGDLQGEAITITDQLISEHHAIDDGDQITAGNPAGVVIARPINGSLWLREDLNFEGTLVVHGDLVLDGWNMKLRARSGFPVLIVTGRIYVTYYAAGVDIDGVVYASEGVSDFGSTTDTNVTIRGSSLSKKNGHARGLQGQYAIEYDSSLTTLFDPQGWGYGGLVEILSWDR